MNTRRQWFLDPRLLFLGGILAGIGLGLYYGWMVNPVEIIDTDIYDLRADHQDDFVVMVGALYRLEGDIQAARQLLGRLNRPDVENVVVDVTERYIARDAHRQDIHYLVGLAQGLGVVTEPMRPFLQTEAP
jgi:hypothetical protein